MKVEDKIINFSKEEKVIIGIDGPSGSGKTTIAKKLQKDYDFVNISSGLFYRGVAFVELNYSEHWENIVKNNLIKPIIKNNMLYIQYKDEILVNEKLYTQQTTMHTEKISNNIELRKYINYFIRNIVTNVSKCVVEGRDVMTNILKNEKMMKIFLTASLKERTKRRNNQMKNAFETTFYYNQIQQRDICDLKRSNGKLIVTDEEIIINNTDLSITEVLNIIIKMLDFNKLKEIEKKELICLLNNWNI